MPLYVCDATEKALYEVGFDGSSPTKLFNTVAQPPYHPVYDPTLNRFFYFQVDAYSINYDGSSETRIVDTPSSPGQGDIDLTNSKIYYPLTIEGQIRTCDFDGGNDALAFSPVSTRPTRLQVDISGGKVYWVFRNVGVNTEILRADLDGSNEETLVTEADTAQGEIIEQMGLDLVNGKMYWSNSTEDNVKRANLDGTGRETIITPAGNDVWGCAVDGTGGKVYWTEGTPKNVRRANLDGSGVETIWAGATFPAYLLVAGAGGTARKTRWGPWVYPTGPGRSFGQSHREYP